MIEISLDNETLDITPSACVLTVGGVLFEGRTVIETCHFTVDLQTQIDAGRTISASTLQWWLMQTDEARKGLSDASPCSLSLGRAILRDWGVKAQRVWARPGMFDLPMLRSLFGQDIWDDHPPKRPNHGYQKEADLGTLVKEFDPHYALCPQFEGTPHNALDDAKHHHIWLMNIREAIAAKLDIAEHTIASVQPPQIGPTDKKIWTCKIGEVESQTLPFDADGPMRMAVTRVYKELTGNWPEFCFSGWGGSLTELERDVVNKMNPPENVVPLQQPT